MDILDELSDKDALKPEKLFDEKEFSTLIIKREGFSKNQNDAADHIMPLLNKEINREEREQILAKLKEMKAQASMVSAIKEAQRKDEKAVLITACWESALDFSADFLFFTEMVCQDDFGMAIEALTLIENIDEQIEEKVLSEALKIAQNTPNRGKNQILVEDLVKNIKSRLALKKDA